MVLLWVSGEGWKEFKLTDVEALEERNISIGYGASIGDGAIPKIIYIIGSKFPVSYWGENRIDIGCKSLSISDWFEKGYEIAEKENFTSEQVTEYKSYIEFIQTIHQAKKENPKEA